jgi:hypothetical protein
MSAAVPAPGDILNARDLLTDARNLVEAIYMMANGLDRIECGAFQRVAEVAKDTIKRADAILNGDDDGEAE